ncbi:MAG: hypothetical protein H6622_03600 [Halobacteriovoraceae bacterium]|nr:hypothetical protein [Halobacteriovoraceae bacterium]
MRSQVHNKGELKELNVNIEAEVVDKIKRISENTGMSLDEIVVIAVKRYITAHTDYLGAQPNTD